MTLVSFAYGCFLLVTMVGYWGLGGVGSRWKQGLLLLASVAFYGLLQPQFLLLLAGLTVFNFSGPGRSPPEDNSRVSGLLFGFGSDFRIMG
ncbi:hypothetical protein [Picosynechococcus sp. NKBG15041c]|uniref:hypothetical protein n=1 Tax=Picosynechococcus sp. NKBG15041c TaxID=1407650 RepID=UPI001F24B89C|nr:hypothetical protein [Picosynechococcus sp. NKBG15041c]